MELLLNTISLIGPVILAGFIYSLKNISMEIKMILWIVCAAIIIFDLYLIIKDKKMKREKIKRESLYNRLYEKQELIERDMPGILLDIIKRNITLNPLFVKGRKQEEQYRMSEAVETFKQCLNQSGLSELDEVTLYILIGNGYYFLSQPNVAEKYFREALSHLKKIENEEIKSLATSHILGNIGNIYHHLGKPDEALDYYKQALELHRKLAYEKGVAHNLRNIGTIYNELNQFDEALKYQKGALEIDKKIENEQGVAICLANIGSVHHDLSQYEEALSLYKEALVIYQRINNKEGIANIYNRIGLNYSSHSDMNLAISEYKKALEINQKIGYREGMASNLGNIGLAYITLGESEKALKSYQEALELFEQMDTLKRKEILFKIIKVIKEEKIKIG